MSTPEVVYYTATSTDGFIADAANSLDWLFEVPEPEQDDGAYARFVEGVGALVLGRTTYEWVLAHEDLIGSPEKWTEWYGERPAWVFTHRDDLPPIPGVDVRFVQGSVREHHAEVLASAGGRGVWVMGGGDLAGQYADAGLLDRIELSVMPVFLGEGAPLLPRRLGSRTVRFEAAELTGQYLQVRLRVSGLDQPAPHDPPAQGG